MARDKQYDLMFNLQDSGYQGLGNPGENPISYLINQPSNPGEFLQMNENILDEGRRGLLSGIFNAFQNPFSSLYEEEEEDPFKLDEDDLLNLDYEEEDIDGEGIEEEDITKTAIGTDKIKLKQTPSGGRGINNPRY